MLKRLAATLAALLLVSGGVNVAVASTRSTFGSAAHATMAGVTTLRWTGQAGIVFDIPAGTALEDGDVDLTTVGASYAFVRLVPEVDNPNCPSTYGPRCDAWRFDWERAVYTLSSYDSVPPSRRHFDGASEPPVWHHPKMDAYLFTDGTATLRMKWRGLRGARSITPTGAFRGRVESVPVKCFPLGCSTSTGRSNGIMYGGDSFDLEGRGWLDVTSLYTSDEPNSTSAAVTNNQVHGQDYCFFPNPNDPTGSPSASSHPYGCGGVPANSGDASTSVLVLANQAVSSQPTVLTSYSTFWSGPVGRVYAGFRADGAGPDPSHAAEYAVWFRYGIH
jgi:hypothetical protein